MTRDELWEQGYTYGGGYYIHLHQKHIGAMKTHKPVESDSLVRTFTGQRNKAREAIQQQYKELFLANVNIEGYNALEELFKDNGNIDLIDEVLYDFFQQGLNSQKIQDIINTQKEIDWASSQYNLKDKLETTSLKWEGFDSLLEGLAKSVELLNATDGRAIASLIRDAQTKGTIGEVGKELQKSLNNIKIDNTTIEGEILQKAIETLNTFANRLATADTSGKLKEDRIKDSPITIEFLKSSIDRNYFSTVLGESAVADMNILAVNQANIEFEKTLENIRSTGKTPTALLKSNFQGSYAGNVEIGASRQGKADVKFNNLTLNLDEILNKEGYGKITLSIGLSNKAYKTLGLKDNGKLTKESLITGGSIKVNDVFDMLTANTRIRYLGYNVLAWSSSSAPKDFQDDSFNIEPALSALQDALFTRATLYLFSARGKIDFSNFMVINGKLISMWEIVEKILNQRNIATTSTMNNSWQGIIYSLPGRASWWKNINGNNIFNHATRTQMLNDAINNSRIEGHINPFYFD